MLNTNTAAIEALRSFAISYVSGVTPRECADRPHFSAFAHLCTAALNGEEWAVERLEPALAQWASTTMAGRRTALRLAVIRATDTSRPDGARSIQL